MTSIRMPGKKGKNFMFSLVAVFLFAVMMKPTFSPNISQHKSLNEAEQKLKEAEQKIKEMTKALRGATTMNSNACEDETENSKDLNKETPTGDEMHLRGVEAASRDLTGVTVDVSYNLNVPKTWYDKFETTSPSYNEVMTNLHGLNVWEDQTTTKPILSSFLDFLNVFKDPDYEFLGSPLRDEVLLELLQKIKPKIFLEVGVFHGMTSTKVAKYFKEHQGFEESFVMSMDTWLLDIRFEFRGSGSQRKKESETNSYFNAWEQGGYSTMYYRFLSNCIKTKTTDRIVPVPTASQNGAMALLSHGIRPDVIYVDASHANPDVYIDLENFYTILKPGGVIAFDDTNIPAVRAALDKLIEKYELKVYESPNQAHIFKVKEKYE